MQTGAPGALQWDPFSGFNNNTAWNQFKRPAAVLCSRRYGLHFPKARLRSDDQSKANMTG